MGNNYSKKINYSISINNLDCKNEVKISGIIEEMKLNLIVDNQIIIEEKIIDELIQIYNISNKDNCSIILLRIISYIWLLKDKKMLKDMSVKLFNKNELIK